MHAATSRPYRARIAQRRFHLAAGGKPVIDFPLDHGGCYRLVSPDAAGLAGLIDTLDALPGAAVMPGQGGLLGAMTVGENLALGLCYGLDPTAVAALDSPLRETLHLCGLGGARLDAILHERPMNLDRVERLALGFARLLLRPPELLVLDRLFAGLSPQQIDPVVRLEALFHLRHPFRTTLFVDIASHDLPALPHCRGEARLAPVAPHVALH